MEHPNNSGIAETVKPSADVSVSAAGEQSASASTARDGDLDDEFDELDDILDEFDNPNDDLPSAPQETTSTEVPEVDEDWARMLQAGMADLLNDVNESPEMQTQFQKLAKELNDAMTSSGGNVPDPTATSNQSAATPKSEPSGPNFQDRIKQTMDRMKSSNAEVNAGLAEDENDDFLTEILKQIGGNTEGGENDFSDMLVNMMDQLTSKEILYEPMKELNDKYPQWIQNNEAKQSEEDMARYREQHSIVKEIVEKFEESTYEDGNEKDREYIIDRMQKMQLAGAPPQELMGDMSQGLNAPDDEPNCGVQ